jgi:hypothetical protein
MTGSWCSAVPRYLVPDEPHDVPMTKIPSSRSPYTVSTFPYSLQEKHTHQQPKSWSLEGQIDSPLQSRFHETRVSHDQHRRRANEPEESRQRSSEPEQRDTYASTTRDQYKTIGVRWCRRTNDEETSVELLLIHDVFTNLHRLRSCTRK